MVVIKTIQKCTLHALQLKKLTNVLSPELIIIKMNTAYHFPFVIMSAIMIELGEVKKLYVLRNETHLTPANNF